MRIGVTGNYASGKGTVCRMFEDLGGIHIDTDIIARDIVQPGMKCFNEIVDHFGENILDLDGSLNRSKIAEIVFNQKSELESLNAIMHPEILRITLELTNDDNCIYFINAPLLFEAGFDKYMDKIICIKSIIDQQVDRGIKRDNITRDQVIKRLNNQNSLNEKLEASDYIIDNSDCLLNTKKQVMVIWKILTKTLITTSTKTS